MLDNKTIILSHTLIPLVHMKVSKQQNDKRSNSKLHQWSTFISIPLRLECYCAWLDGAKHHMLKHIKESQVSLSEMNGFTTMIHYKHMCRGNGHASLETCPMTLKILKIYHDDRSALSLSFTNIRQFPRTRNNNLISLTTIHRFIIWWKTAQWPTLEWCVLHTLKL